MAGITINFSEIEGSFEPLPEGEYECVVERVEVRESQSSEHDYLNWELKVLDEEYEDRRLWQITSLSPRALFRLKDVLVALDVIDPDDELDIEWEEDVDITPKEGPLVTEPDLEGLACVAVVTNEVYEGRERNRVSDLLGADGATIDRATEKEEEPEDEEEDEEEEAPKRKKQTTRKASGKKKAPAKKGGAKKAPAKRQAKKGGNRRRKLR